MIKGPPVLLFQDSNVLSIQGLQLVYLLQSCAQSGKWEWSGHETAWSEQREQSGCETTQVVWSGHETAWSEQREQSGCETTQVVWSGHETAQSE